MTTGHQPTNGIDAPSAGGADPAELTLWHEHGRSLRVRHRAVELLRYVHRPADPQRESPRPYFHPIRTLSGDPVTVYRPHDHVWHKGIALSLPNVGTENFWGGTTYRRGRGYLQLANNGAIVHREFAGLRADPSLISVDERLDWVTEGGQTWLHEWRRFAVTVGADGWMLGFSTRLHNISPGELEFGSPTTEGRDNAGYGGLFWRGPRSFTGGVVHTAAGSGGDELMGIRSPWLGFTGQHDGHGRRSTLVFVDGQTNPGHPTKWFVRSTPFACVCPAPFFDTALPLPPGESIELRYAVVVADGDHDPSGVAALAEAGQAALPAAT